MRLALTTILLLAAAPALADPVVTSFDVPGAQYTIVTAISPSGIVAGYYITAQAGPCQDSCGFVRTPDGTIATFSIGDDGLAVTGVNDNGSVAGYYTKNSLAHGFLRTPDGTVTKIGGPNNYATAQGINASGIVMGLIGRSYPPRKGFLRMPDGTMTFYKGEHCKSLEAYGINAAGAVTGSCDGTTTASGFVREPDGTITTFKAPGQNETYAIRIDDSGDIAGYFFPRHQSGASGFVRDPDGTLHPYSFPGDFGSFGVSGIALVGADRQTVGDVFFFSEKLWHGWIRHDDGTFEIFRVDQGTQPNTGTSVAGLTPSGVIAGFYKNDDGIVHGYIRTP